MPNMNMEKQKQKLIDIVFQIGITISDPQLKMHEKTTEERAKWIADRLHQCGYPTSPVGSSWGVLTSFTSKSTYRMTDEELKSVVSYVADCYKNTTIEKLAVKIKAWYEHNHPILGNETWPEYNARSMTRSMHRGLMEAMQDAVVDESETEMRCLAYVLNTAGGSLISDAKMIEYMHYLAWCLRCTSRGSFVHEYLTTFGTLPDDDLIGRMFENSTDTKSTCFFIEVASTLDRSSPLYNQIIHILNPGKPPRKNGDTV